MHITPGLIGAGALIGFLIGLTGMGGGSLTTPFLILFMHVRPVLAVGTDLVYASITKLVGTGTHLRQRTVDLRVGAYVIAGAVPAALAGVFTVNAFGVHGDAFVRKMLGFVLVLVALSVIVRQFLKAAERQHRHRPWVTVAVGAVVGYLVGVTSVGSGTLMMAVLLFAYRVLPSDKLVGTDIFYGFVISAVAGIAHIGAGHVEWNIVASLLIGSIPGVWLGSKVSVRAPERVLRPLLAGVLLLSGLKMI
jgi:uncharacterized membrane protein YfcA